MDDPIVAGHLFLYWQLPQFQGNKIIDGHHRFHVFFLHSMEIIRDCECAGWQFEPDSFRDWSWI